MSTLSNLAAKYLAMLSHVPIIGPLIGHFDWVTFIVILFLGAGTTAWVIGRYGNKVPVPEGKWNFIARGKAAFHNWRAATIMSIGNAPAIIALTAVFAMGMLGTGSEVDLGKGPNTLGPHDTVIADRVRPGLRDGVEGIHLIMLLVDDKGTPDEEHPYCAFIPNDQIRTSSLKEGGKFGLAVGELNKALVVDAVPTYTASN